MFSLNIVLVVLKQVLAHHKSVLVLTGKLTFTVLGGILVAISAFYESSFLAILGAALAFWGTILFYLTPIKHVPLTFLNNTANTDSENIQRVFNEYSYNEKGIYLPPKNLNSKDSSLVFIPRDPLSTLPVLDEVINKITCKGANGLFITPPGAGLSKLFEEETDTLFMKMDMSKLSRSLPKIMVSNLEVAESVQVESADTVVIIRLKSAVITSICRQAKGSQHSQVGCLFPSALACVLAKVTGKPVVIRNEVTNQEAGTMEVEYQLL